MPRVGLTREAVIDEAARLIDEVGLDGLTLAVLAARLGVRIPSIYKHVDGMPAVQRGIMLCAKRGLAEATGKAAVGRSRDDAITAMSLAFRHWALQHPGQYPLTTRAPIPGDESDRAASAALIDVVNGVLSGYGLRHDDAVHATRFLRAAIHGFVALETSGGFELPVDRERSYQLLVESVVTALAAWTVSD